MIRRSKVRHRDLFRRSKTRCATSEEQMTSFRRTRAGSAEDQATPQQAVAVRKKFGLGATTPLVLYTGTFEAYQGLDLLFAAMHAVKQSRPDARLLLGTAAAIDSPRGF